MGSSISEFRIAVQIVDMSIHFWDCHLSNGIEIYTLNEIPKGVTES